MNKQREALQLALETLEDLNGISTDTQSVTIWVNDEIELIEKALAKPEQDKQICNCAAKDMPFGRCCKALPARKPLTTEQINSLGDKIANEKLVGPVMDFRVRLARAIERAHGIGEP